MALVAVFVPVAIASFLRHGTIDSTALLGAVIGVWWIVQMISPSLRGSTTMTLVGYISSIGVGAAIALETGHWALGVAVFAIIGCVRLGYFLKNRVE
ncbi:MAG: hypothetical protein M3P30_07160 [Chloroflexota bacterium]|nr:hypothetical protein [Chloroflexota bacterium]